LHSCSGEKIDEARLTLIVKGELPYAVRIGSGSVSNLSKLNGFFRARLNIKSAALARSRIEREGLFSTMSA